MTRYSNYNYRTSSIEKVQLLNSQFLASLVRNKQQGFPTTTLAVYTARIPHYYPCCLYSKDSPLLPLLFITILPPGP